MYIFLRYLLIKNQLPNVCNKVAKKCAKYLIPKSILPPAQRIVVIGDIHSDLRVSIKIFKKCKLIDENYNWIADPKNTIVVQMGDQIDGYRPGIKNFNDECMSDIQVISFFNKMNTEAQKYGGGVYSLLGNHEIMNLQGIFNYVTKFGFDEFNGYSKRIQSFSKGGLHNNLLACTRNTILKIGSWLFVHGGILPKTSKTYKIDELNNIVRSWILGKTITESMHLINDHHESPFWNRNLGKLQTNLSLNDIKCQKILKPTMDTYDIGGMVVAHTPQFLGINGTCGNRVWRVDVGLSSVFQNNFKKLKGIQVMEIWNDKKIKIINI